MYLDRQRKDTIRPEDRVLCFKSQREVGTFGKDRILSDRVISDDSDRMISNRMASVWDRNPSPKHVEVQTQIA